MSIDDNYFGCSETPIWIPNGFDIARIPASTSYKLRLISLIAGTCNVSKRDDGLLIDENTTVSLSINGVQYNLMESILMIGGAHKLPEQSAVNIAEYALYFKHNTDFSRHICLTLPISIGTNQTYKSREYFKLLNTGINNNRPKLGQIIPNNADYLVYRGADLRGRTATNSQSPALCSPIKRVITYYVSLSPIYIDAVDFQRLKLLAGNAVGPAKPLFPVVNARLIQLGTIISGIDVEIINKADSSSVSRAIPTSAMKCYKLNPDKDVIGDKIYIGGNHTTLSSELSTNENISDNNTTSIKPGDIQKWMGILLGVIAGLIICSIITYLIWSGTFKNYLQAQKLYKSPITNNT